MTENEKGMKKLLERAGKVRWEKISIGKMKGKMNVTKSAGTSVFLLGILLLAAVVAESGCVEYGCERGSGNVEIITRSIEPFHSLDSRIPGNVFIEQGDSSLKIEAEDNILPLLETNVENGVLVIRAKERICPQKTIKIYAGMEEVRSLSLSGSGDITGTMPISSENLDLTITGSGDIELETNTSSLKSLISGSGDILLKGNASSHEIDIGGSGNIDALELRTEVTRVSIRGSGNANVYADRKLDTNISGSGNVFYEGNPEEFNMQVSGSGEVKSKDRKIIV
ncbi:head GIN domain-containing protein [Methanosarcina sp.]|uniref:head GIN domain-containing protein n=1 Tax=Methanosarcina sp. TaxID=2213 RepID=UPI002988E9E0|nr:head GIN domain-containing protein [Methanosarcina sp.]MDW5550070.1 head GIN domain-containing protein [Methanosarcina sp.]MDW5554024.1 head GIN domain-containing protein [Methanosarcina sp.]MDW5558471.1 head GIN domain-containing protein [Methanosarcina sp.]